MEERVRILDGRYWVYPDGRIINARTGNEVYGTFNQKWGHLELKVCINGKWKRYCKHRLVAKAFVENPNPQAFTRVHFKNGDRSDCRAENLYWGRRYPNYPIPLAAYHLDGTLDKCYANWYEVEQDGYVLPNVHHCLSGVCRTHKKRIWKWYEGGTDGNILPTTSASHPTNNRK